MLVRYATEKLKNTSPKSFLNTLGTPDWNTNVSISRTFQWADKNKTGNVRVT